MTISVACLWMWVHLNKKTIFSPLRNNGNINYLLFGCWLKSYFSFSYGNFLCHILHTTLSMLLFAATVINNYLNTSIFFRYFLSKVCKKKIFLNKPKYLVSSSCNALLHAYVHYPIKFEFGSSTKCITQLKLHPISLPYMLHIKYVWTRAWRWVSIASNYGLVIQND